MTKVRRWTVVAALAAVTVLGAGTQVLTAPPARAADLTAETVRKDLAFAEARLAATAGRTATNAYPVRTGANGAWVTAGAGDWTSGFFPGALWQAYAHTKDPVWKQRAEAWQAGVEVNKTDDGSHDVGFQIFNTFGQDAVLTGDANAKAVALTAARTLSTRYNAKVGAIRSWDARTDTTRYQVIMDNMMNLELLWWAAQNGGDPAWATIATNHAKTTARDFFRPDGGSWHVVNYNQATGAVASKYTHQGYSNDSTWSRGQAWAVHGFTMAYRFTKDAQFLTTARSSADYFLSRLPADKVPYWDFNLPSTAGQPRDSSAAAIAASGLVELSTLEPDATRKQRYLAGARDIIASLSTPAYLADGTTNQAVLLHGTQNKPSGSADTGIMFGDHYFIEALRRHAAATGIDLGTTPPTTTTPTTTTPVPPTTTTPKPPTTTAPATDPVTAYYQKLGGASSYLGAPKAAVYTVAGGRAQDYAGGSIYWSQATGAHAVRGAILTRYKALNGPSGVLGFPTTDETTFSGGRRTDFAKGTIVWYQATNQTYVFTR
ncbi:glycoside hydrolase family 88 protein [Actinomycetospora sp. OC33-EN08]|uniref:Glycoside hydrolase family 88 protein n=1 Tax=Actinomycetospora aurantiaca TaxID=3129233 RepID=A0ABU8MZ84_9PSEU